MLCNCGHSQVTLIFLIEDTSRDKGVVSQPFLKQCFSCLAVSRWQAMQCWRLYTRYRCLPAARLHILLASGIRAEKERGRTGEKRRCGCCATFANVTDLELLCSCCELCSIPNVKQSFFCGLKVNWLGEVKCSAVIPEISPRFPQLPVISVVRETETQLLPDVGAIVTCKVRSESFQRISKVVVFGFVRGVIGFSYLTRWPASTPDTPRSTSCMWAPHRWRTASGGQSGTRGAPQSHVLCFIPSQLL